MSIVVTTPTGHVGSHVVRLLLQAGARPTLILRDPDKLDPETRALVDVRQGDQGDLAFVREATQGAEALYWVDPPDYMGEDALATSELMAANAAEAVSANGIPRVVFQSSVGAEKRHGAGLIDGLARHEEALDATEADVVHLRCGYFYSNLLQDVGSLRAGVLTSAWPREQRMPWVDPRDIAAVVVSRLLSTSWSGKHVQAVHGPEHFTFGEVAETLSDVTGRKITLQLVSDDDVRQGLDPLGMSERTVEGIVAMASGLREDFTPEQERTVVTTTPTTLGEWAWSHLRPALQES